MLLRRQLRLAGATAAVSFSRHRRYCFDAPAARGFIRQAPHLVGLFCWSGLSGWSGLSDWFGLSVGLFVGWSIGLVGLVSVVWCLLVSSVLFIGLGWRLVCLVGLVCLLLCL